MPAKWRHRYQSKPGRWVFDPTPEARAEGSEIKAFVEAHWSAPPYYYHLRSGGHLAALRSHLHHAFFFKADIADFFGSVTRSRISRLLKEFASHDEALRFATASTVRHPGDPTRRILPYGFIQSPVLASLALHKSSFGKRLDALYASGNVTVSVYVDDTIVSGDEVAELQAILDELSAASEKSRLPFNASKTQGPNGAIRVFNIDVMNGCIALSPDKLDELRDAFAGATSDHQKAGLRAYVGSVNDEQLGHFIL